MNQAGWGLESSSFTSILIAIVLSGLVGLEREISGRPAGLRTHVMVCLGATILILASKYNLMNHPSSAVVFNPDRMAQGIITGIGFLGAGAILREEKLVRGLTTAGCIWFVAGLGIVIGKGQYGLAFLATASALVVLVLLRFLEGKLSITQYQEVVIRAASKDHDDIMNNCQDLFKKHGLRIEKKNTRIDNSRNETEMSYTLIHKRKAEDTDGMVREISKMSGVLEVNG